MAKTKQQMGKAARRKGGQEERNIVKNICAIGVQAHKVPLSGAVEGYKGDIIIDVLGGLQCEVKSRKSGEGFTQLEKWMGDNDILFLKRNRKNAMVVVEWGQFLYLLQKAAEMGEIEEQLKMKPTGPRKCTPTGVDEDLMEVAE